jgi:hypothetical protein
LTVPEVTRKNRMYEQSRKSLNWFVGCRNECVYCKPSFQAQMKRQLHNCKTCYLFEPHAHLERLTKSPPRTKDGEFIFFPSSGDIEFCSLTDMITAIEYAKKYSDRTFLMQSKNAGSFLEWVFPENVVVGITMETDQYEFEIPKECKYKKYSEISKACAPYWRYKGMLAVEHKRKFVTIEPILDYTSDFADLIEEINPEFVYIGYDNHNCRLPEPPLASTLDLIEELKEFTEVRIKTLREAWWVTERENLRK